MDIRYNINRIDVLLQEKFENVSVKENSSTEFGKYFEITVKQDREVKMILPYKNIDGTNTFEFLYFSMTFIFHMRALNLHFDFDSHFCFTINLINLELILKLSSIYFHLHYCVNCFLKFIYFSF